MTDDRQEADHEPWPIRALLLLGLGALCGLAVWLLVQNGTNADWTTHPLRLAAAAALVVAGIAFAVTLERQRLAWSAAFAACAGLIVGLVTLLNGSGELWGSSERWRFTAALLAVALAVPLFQAARDSGSRKIDPGAAHDHVWTDLILWGLAWAFVGALILTVVLLGGLFELIGLDFIMRLMRAEWFPAMLIGGAFGAAVGLLRDRDKVLVLLQRVGRTILSMLAPLLAAGLLCFVLALLVTGLGPLWRETAATTPLLLACILGATVLANAVIGNAPEEEPKARILLWAAMALSAVMLPLAIVAAVSMAKRIGQYGFTPDRLWASVVVAVAVAAAAAYLHALVRGRTAFAARLRRTNVALATGICLLAIFLALPIVNFGAISARNQVAMLQSGRIAPDKFDWRAMRFDFGPAGVRALERLRESAPEELRARASAALAMTDRWSVDRVEEGQRERAVAAQIRVLPTAVDLPPELVERLTGYNHCRAGAPCFIFYETGSDRAVAVSAPDCSPAPPKGVISEDECLIEVSNLQRTERGWGPAPDRLYPGPDEGKAQLEALLRNKVEIRPVTRRQVFVDGRPVGEPFE